MDVFYRNKNFVVREVDSEAFLLDTKTGYMHVLNRTALDIWNIMESHNTVENITEEMNKIYGHDVNKAILKTDIKDMIDMFFEQGLIKKGK